MDDRGKKTALFDQFARVGKAMVNGKRLELIGLLSQGEHSVETIAAAAGLGLSTASAHLQALKQTVMDVRPPEECRAAHIPGAVSIPLEQLTERISELPTDKSVAA